MAKIDISYKILSILGIWIIALILGAFPYDKCLKLVIDSLSIIKRRIIFRNSISTYKYEELKCAAIFSLFENYSEGIFYFYRLSLVFKSGEKLKIFDMSDKLKEKLDYLKYLVDLINKHINSNIKNWSIIYLNCLKLIIL